jgi:hypothetical protein
MRRGELGRDENWRPRNEWENTCKCGQGARQGRDEKVLSKQNDTGNGW